MTLTLCDNLKSLRKSKNNTQEDLADFLSVSITAVSKWERGDCYPDIELLPKIAAFYNISVDKLLGVDEIRQKERIDEIMEKRKHFSGKGDKKSVLEIMLEAEKEFPNNWRILSSLLHALNNYESEKNAPKIIQTGERILSECTIDEYRYTAIQVLCFLYKKMGDIEKAKKYAQMAPIYHVTVDELYCDLTQGDEAIADYQNNLVSLVDLIVRNLKRYRKRVSGGEAKRVLEAALKFYWLLYEDGDFVYHNRDVADLYAALAELAAENQEKSETLGYLANAAKYAVCQDTLDTKNEKPHTSFLVNRISFDPAIFSFHKLYMYNESYKLLEKMKDKKFDFCRGNQEFIDLTADLQKTADSGESSRQAHIRHKKSRKHNVFGICVFIPIIFLRTAELCGRLSNHTSFFPSYAGHA